MPTTRKSAYIVDQHEGLWSKRRLRKAFWYVVFLLAIMSIFAVHFLPARYHIAENEVATDNITANQTITFVDEIKTAALKKEAADKISEVYVINNDVIYNMEEEIVNFYKGLDQIVAREDLTNQDKVNAMMRDYNLSEMAAKVYASLERDTVRILETESINLLRDNWQKGVKDFEVESKREDILNQIELLNYNAPFREIMKANFKRLNLLPNLYLDQAATLRAKQEASNAVDDVLVTVRKDQIIVRRGEVVTAEQMNILRALGYQAEDRPALTMTGIAVFLVICTILTVLYMKFYHRDTYGRGNSMLILAVLALITLFITKLIISINISSRPEIAELVNYLVPVAMGSMLMAILLDTKIAIFMTMLLSICVGLLTDGQLTYAIVSFVSGTVGIFSVSRFSQRLDWVRAGIYVVGANILTIAAINLLNNQDWTILLYSLALGILNGFFSTILAYGIAPFLESGFKVTTSVRLLELSNPSQPLLKRLLTEAPGTYHHSIMVANLSEAAADAIGADSLLVRAGAYYHDIGKLKRPYFFIENQLGGENPHEKLTPALSTLIITSHPKDGLELAQQYGLPPVITDLIYQHHGKGLASYFYHKAVELGNADNISEDDFRYDAAKPQTKEAAIIMLADSVEAAVRAMDSSSPDKIENLVRKIIKERLEDGQLDESDLTFKDLDKIAEAFCHILSGVYHTRIEYPDNVLQAMEKGGLTDGNTVGESAE
ncbi:MAG: HDIG domain-containing metalloprotein [Peptococcia bacterium]